ncbi:hypothetical protein MMC07_004394 [Pseudocyphellaria aurata]|nr:hypothetical protein [Pseudocyphellaria aurata]
MSIAGEEAITQQETEAGGENAKGKQKETIFEEIDADIKKWNLNMMEWRGLEPETKLIPQLAQFMEIDPLQGAWALEQERQALPKRAGSKYHCLLQRHSFERPPRTEPSGKSKNKIEDKWVRCDRCGRRMPEAYVLVCQVDVCGMRACISCVQEWDNERHEAAERRGGKRTSAYDRWVNL